MRIKLLFLILCSPLFTKAQVSIKAGVTEYDYSGLFFLNDYRNYKFPYRFTVLNDTLFISSIKGPPSERGDTLEYYSSPPLKAFIIKDTVLTDSTGRDLWKLNGASLMNVTTGKYFSYTVINSYMIERYDLIRPQYFFMTDHMFMGHVGPDYPDGAYASLPSADKHSPLKQKMQRIAILLYLAELVNAE